MKARQSTFTEAAVWDRLLRPNRGDLPPEAAHFFLQLQFDPDDLQRMHRLVVKNQEGALSSVEKEALRTYRQIGMQIDLLRAKARLSLQHQRNRH